MFTAVSGYSFVFARRVKLPISVAMCVINYFGCQQPLEVPFMGFSLVDKIKATKQKISSDLTIMIREKAIANAKSRIALSGKSVSDLSLDEIEVITAEEEQKIMGKVKASTVAAALVILGIN